MASGSRNRLTLPVLANPAATIGTIFSVLGDYWGKECAAKDRGATFNCTITDYEVGHTFADKRKRQAVEMHEETSGTFWMAYPQPFLRYWYATYPMAKECGGSAICEHKRVRSQ